MNNSILNNDIKNFNRKYSNSHIGLDNLLFSNKIDNKNYSKFNNSTDEQSKKLYNKDCNIPSNTNFSLNTKLNNSYENMYINTNIRYCFFCKLSGISNNYLNKFVGQQSTIFNCNFCDISFHFKCFVDASKNNIDIIKLLCINCKQNINEILEKVIEQNKNLNSIPLLSSSEQIYNIEPINYNNHTKYTTSINDYNNLENYLLKNNLSSNNCQNKQIKNCSNNVNNLFNDINNILLNVNNNKICESKDDISYNSDYNNNTNISNLLTFIIYNQNILPETKLEILKLILANISLNYPSNNTLSNINTIQRFLTQNSSSNNKLNDYLINESSNIKNSLFNSSYNNNIYTSFNLHLNNNIAVNVSPNTLCDKTHRLSNNTKNSFDDSKFNDNNSLQHKKTNISNKYDNNLNKDIYSTIKNKFEQDNNKIFNYIKNSKYYNENNCNNNLNKENDYTKTSSKNTKSYKICESSVKTIFNKVNKPEIVDYNVIYI